MIQGRVIAWVVVLVVVDVTKTVVEVRVVVSDVKVNATVTVGENVVRLRYDVFAIVTVTVGE
jgi:hypothetical protein